MAFLMDISGVWADQWFVILLFLGAILWGTSLIGNWLGNIMPGRLSTVELLSLGISASLLPLLAWACVYHLLGLLFAAGLPLMTVACIFIPFLLWKSGSTRTITGLPILLAAFAIFLVCISINMALIAQITFPAYFDSPEHYRIIKSLLETNVFEWPTLRYYHPGYHLILAAMSRLSRSGIVDGMLISGQLALSILAASLFFMIKRETASTAAALFTFLLAGFGWYMPAHAINWGKYPAIFGLICSVFVFNLIHLMLQNNLAGMEKRRLIPLLSFGILAAGFIHTRSLIICALFTISLLIANAWSTFDKKPRRLILGMFLFILLIGVLCLKNDVTFGSLISSYIKEDSPTLMLACVLGVFSVWRFPKPVFALLLFISLLVCSIYIPLPDFWGYQNLFLLDRPYVQILLHIPVSLICGLGFAALLEATTARQFAGTLPAGAVIQTAVFGFLAMNAIFFQEYRPSNCCQLAGRDDAAAFSWIQQELPREATVLIASQDLSFTQNQSHAATTGVDAGIWVAPITERKTLFLPSRRSFTRSRFYDRLCKLGVDYIYVGNKPESFNESDLIQRPAWYQAVFILPDVKIYKLTQCS
jgi:hypothetical protein